MSWQLERAMEREEDALDRALERGEITRAEHAASVREMRRDYADQLRAEAEEAYDRIMRGDW